LREKKFSARELTEAHLAAIEALNPRLNAYVTVTAERALAQADAADAALSAGKFAPLTGIPLAIKDLFCTEGVRTTAGSRILAPFVPPYESTVSANLLRDGAIFLGKANMDEFAMGSSNMTSAYGPVANPWQRRQDREAVLVPGGSSGGSAAAVAARIAMGATGTDTGGSIRQPASFCGVVGMKPTYGRCSRWGVVAFASSLDHPGPFGRTVEDCAILLASMAGHDPKDSTSADVPVPDFAAA
jgi:aspartyl-tRNA(Asn)/glutamyl-tRNA(Gln) amidotransferase subunit A